MKRIALWALVGGAALSSIACGKDQLIPIPSGRAGAMSVAGSARARSSHFKIIGTLGSGGGPHGSPSAHLHDGSFVNGQK